MSRAIERRLGVRGGWTVAAVLCAAVPSAFAANPWDNDAAVQQVLERFALGAVNYAAVEQRLDYAGSHGPDIVVLMGEEVVVPGPTVANAGKRIHRRFTDVFRKENGEWRHDVRHANVISVEQWL